MTTYTYRSADAARRLGVGRVVASGASAPIKIDVVKTKAAELKRRIPVVSGSGYIVDKAFVALTPKIVVPPVKNLPHGIMPWTTIPLEVRAPTAKLVSDHNGTGFGMPWTTSPAAFPLIGGAAIGSMLVMLGRQVVAEMAIAGAEDWVNNAKKRYNQRGVQFRFLTGKSPLGKGNIVRPRGEDGKLPEGTDPYEDPDDFTWWKPWTWA